MPSKQNTMDEKSGVGSFIHGSPPRWRHLKANIRAFIIHLPPRTLPSCCPALPRPPIPCPVQTSGTRLLPFHREIQLSSVDEFRTSIHPLHSSATPPRHSKGPVDDRRAAIHPSHVAAMLLHKEISQQSAMDGRRYFIHPMNVSAMLPTSRD